MRALIFLVLVAMNVFGEIKISTLESSLCYGESYTLTATHPELGGSTGYLPEVFWLKNGVEHNPDGYFEIATRINSTTTNLTVIIREDFVDGTAYQASIINTITGSRETSSNVALFEIKKPVSPIYKDMSSTDSTITVEFSHQISRTCYESVSFSFVIHCSERNERHPESFNTTDFKYTLKSLKPSTNYTIMLEAVSESHGKSPHVITYFLTEASIASIAGPVDPPVISIVIPCIVAFLVILSFVIGGFAIWRFKKSKRKIKESQLQFRENPKV